MVRLSAGVGAAAGLLCALLLVATGGVQAAWFKDGSLPSKCRLGQCDSVTVTSNVSVDVSVNAIGVTSLDYFLVTVTATGLTTGNITGVYIGLDYELASGDAQVMANDLVIKNSPIVTDIHYNTRFGPSSGDLLMPFCSNHEYQLLVDVDAASTAEFRIYPNDDAVVDFGALRYAVRIDSASSPTLNGPFILEFECGATPAAFTTTPSTCGGNTATVTCPDSKLGTSESDTTTQCTVAISPPVGSWCECNVTVDLAVSDSTGAAVDSQLAWFGNNVVTFTPGSAAQQTVPFYTATTIAPGSYVVAGVARNDSSSCFSGYESATFALRSAGRSHVDLASCLPVGTATQATLTTSVAAPSSGWSLDISVTQGTAAGGAKANCTVTTVAGTGNINFIWTQTTQAFLINCAEEGDIFISYTSVGETAGYISAPRSRSYHVRSSCDATTTTGTSATVSSPTCSASLPTGMRSKIGYGGVCLLQPCGSESLNSGIMSITPIDNYFRVEVQPLVNNAVGELHSVSFTWAALGNTTYASDAFNVVGFGAPSPVTALAYDSLRAVGEAALSGCTDTTVYNLVVSIGTDNSGNALTTVQFDVYPPDGAQIDFSQATFSVRAKSTGTLGVTTTDTTDLGDVQLTCTTCPRK